MEKLIMASIFFTELLTMLVLGIIVLGVCVFLYDYLKKENKNEKR